MEFAFSCTKGKQPIRIGTDDSYLTLKLVEVERNDPRGVFHCLCKKRYSRVVSPLVDIHQGHFTADQRAHWNWDTEMCPDRDQTPSILSRCQLRVPDPLDKEDTLSQ
jgi:hypothetical protein